MLKYKGIEFLYAATMIYLMTLPLGNKYLLYISRIPALMVIMLLVFRKLKENGIAKQCCVAFFGFCIVLILSMAYSVVMPYFDLVLAIVSILALMLLVSCSQHFTIDQSTKDFIQKWSCVCAVAMNIYARTSYGYLYGDRVITYLTLNVGNSNAAGIYLFLLYCVILITMPREWKRALLSVAIEVSLIILIIETGARTVFFALIAITVYYLFFRRKKIRQWMVVAAAAIPFLTVPLYLFLSTVISDEAVLWGKSLFTGREVLFQQGLEILDGIIPWVIGSLKKSPFHNGHNGPLTILVSAGLVGLIMFYIIMYGQLLAANRNSKTSIANIAVAVLMGCYIHTSGEAALVIGGFPAITFMFVFYVLAYDSAIKE